MIMNIQIIDRFLDYRDFLELQKSILDERFTWYSSKFIVPQKQARCEEKYNHQMYHTFYETPFTIHPTAKLIEPILYKLKPEVLLKVKANLTFCTNEIQEHGFHVDIQTNLIKLSKTAVLYLNTNDGYTLFESSNEKIESIENRLVIFDSTEMHSGTSCTNQKYRAVININYIP